MRHTIVPDAAGLPDEGGEVVVGVSGRRWRLGAAPIGEGGQASVWPGVGEGGERVAVKLAHGTRGAREALAGEVALLTALAEAGFGEVVACLDRVEADGRVGFVMPLYPADLGDHAPRVIAGAGERGIEAALGLAARLARALAGLHAVSLVGREGHVVHRDVKPENVLVDGDGRLLLADLGGSLVVAEPVSLALGVFGSPMWAPFDQMLPGLPEPNPTWDTYAACVLLFWWVTGGRPAYQEDPSPMLTTRGRAAWDALRTLATTDGDRQAAHLALAQARAGTRAAELVEVRGHAAIQEEDRAALREGVRRLGSVAVYGEAALLDAARALAELLARGLSPLSHPSPPNRFWSAGELAEQVEAIAARLATAREAREAKAGARTVTAAAPPGAVGAAGAAGSRTSGRRLAWMAVAAPVIAVGGLGIVAVAAAWWMRGGAPEAVSADEADRVVIPAGTTRHGDVWGDGEEDERPARDITLPAFRIGRTEVSNEAYGACVTEGVCTPIVRTGLPPGFDGPTQPAVGVTWQQALTYCAWAGGRLPTEEEWEKAATSATGDGPDKRRWPWGEEAPDCERANVRDCARGTTLPVDTLPEGASAAGALQLVGNAWEWTSGSYSVTKRGLFNRRTVEHKVLRGGSFASTTAAARPTFRRHDEPETVSEEYGVRCVWGGE